jgi:hypothetical protein
MVKGLRCSLASPDKATLGSLAEIVAGDGGGVEESEASVVDAVSAVVDTELSLFSADAERGPPDKRQRVTPVK